MKNVKKIIALAMCSALVVSSFVGCQSKTAQTTQTPSATSAKEDKITALLPPVSPSYQKNFPQMEADFHAKYPNLTLKIESASWEDMTQKLDVQVNAGTPPDIAFIGSDGISKYIQTGLLVDISKIATSDMINDFEPGPLAYMKKEKGLYGFPAYMSIQSIGGNKQFLEAAGIDWKSVQKNGWTFEQFREAIKKGVVKSGDKTSRYGFLFACSGVTAKDYLTLLVKEAGMPSPFTKDLKYAYTSKNYLDVLTGIRQLIDDGSMPKELSSVTAGMRWNMFLTGQTMITGKGLSVFENSAKTNNAKIDSKDASAVKDSIKVDYVVLPLPTFNGNKQQAMGAVDGYVTFRGKTAPTDEHLQNVAKAAYFLASGKVAAQTNNDLFVAQITKSSAEAAKSMTVAIDPDNAAATASLVKQAVEARPDITSELGDKNIQIENTVIVPKFQALLAGEITPQQMYDAVKAAAVQAFGDNGIVKD
jgi:multiple sugar transport system substrate-binding protein